MVMTSEGQIFSQQEMSVAIKKMKENKAADESGVIAEYLKALEVEEVEKLRGLMNGILNGADIPKVWKEGRVKLLHKGGRTDELKLNKIATTPTHIANCFTKQFTNTVKHATHKTNRHINRATHNIQGYNITLTTSQVQEAIKQSKNNNSQGPDKLNIRHLKHIGPLGLPFLTSMFKTALNKNIIPHSHMEVG